LVGVLFIAGLGFATWEVWQWRERIRIFHGVRTSLNERDFESAQAYLDQARERYPETGEFVFWQAVFARRQGRLADAEALLRDAAELGWSTSDVELQRCLTIAQSGRIDLVQARLNEIIQAGTTDEVAEQIYEASTKGHLAAYHIRDAWDCLDFWLKWQPDNMQARRWRGQVLEMVGDRPGAVTEYREILQAHDNDREARQLLGMVLLSMNQVEEAKVHFEWLTDHPPEDPAALIGLARCHRRTGELAAARNLAEAVLKLDLSPQLRAEAQFELGTSLLVLGEPAQAITHLEFAAKEMPANQELRYTLSRTLAQLGRADEAAEQTKLARELETTRIRTMEVLKQLADTPDDTQLRFELARILAEQGETRKAQHWFEVASELNARRTPEVKSPSKRNATEKKISGDTRVDLPE